MCYNGFSSLWLENFPKGENICRHIAGLNSNSYSLQKIIISEYAEKKCLQFSNQNHPLPQKML